MEAVANQTIAELRASLGLIPRRSQPQVSAPSDNQPEPPSLDPPSSDYLSHEILEREIRAQFVPEDCCASFTEQYPMLFSLAGYQDASDHQLLQLIHEIATDTHFRFVPRLGRIARRELRADQLNKLDAAIQHLAERPQDDCEDSLAMVSCMVSEQAVWGLVAELRDLMLDIVTTKCSPCLLDSVTDSLNPNLITQMVSRGAYSAQQLINMLDEIQSLIEQAAPLCVLRYDYWYSPIRAQLVSGVIGKPEDFPFVGLELVETLQDIKLELANWKLSIERPFIVAAAVAWESQLSGKLLSDLKLDDTVTAIQSVLNQLNQDNQAVSCISLHARLFVELLVGENPPRIPEVFNMDAGTIVQSRQRLQMIVLACALWTVGRQALIENDVDIKMNLLTEIRCSMFDSSVQSTVTDHKAWAMTFFYWLHTAAAEQSKTLSTQHQTRLSTQLIAAAEPDGALRKLFRSRIVTMLREREGLGTSCLMTQEERLRFGKCFSLASNELSDVLDSTSALAAHLGTVWYGMYLPFTKKKSRLNIQNRQQTADCFTLWRTKTTEYEEDDDECEDPIPSTMQLSMPGMTTLSYRRSSSKRSRSCGNLVIARQSSCGELASNSEPVRQSTVDHALLRVRKAAP